MPQTSAIPDIYFAIFGVYEPLVTIIGCLAAWLDPKSTHDAQAPWPAGSSPPDALPRATYVTIMQLAHVCTLIGSINFFVLSAARQHLHYQPALQEKIVSALLTPLVVGDVLHIYVTLWALGDEKWQLMNWTPMVWIVIVLGLSMMIPRIAWHLGVGRYVDKRDGRTSRRVLKD